MIYRFRIILDNDTEADIFRDIEINFSKYFQIQRLEKTLLSAEKRKNKEWLGILKRI